MICSLLSGFEGMWEGNLAALSIEYSLIREGVKWQQNVIIRAITPAPSENEGVHVIEIVREHRII